MKRTNWKLLQNVRRRMNEHGNSCRPDKWSESWWAGWSNLVRTECRLLEHRPI